MNSRLRIILLLAVFLAAGCQGGGGKDSPSAINYRDLCIKAIVRNAENQQVSEIDAAQTFIRQNSTHGDGPEFERFNGDYDYTWEMLYRTSINDPAAVRPVLLCFTYAHLMEEALNEMGYQTRIIRYISSFFSELHDHTAVEVYNPDSLSWEAHDPDYDVYYVDISNGHRASVELIATATSLELDVVPCREDECGWWISVPDDLTSICDACPMYQTLYERGYYSAIEDVTSCVLYINHTRYTEDNEYYIPGLNDPVSFEDAAILTSDPKDRIVNIY
jgi:hypothetical protein